MIDRSYEPTITRQAELPGMSRGMGVLPAAAGQRGCSGPNAPDRRDASGASLHGWHACCAAKWSAKASTRAGDTLRRSCAAWALSARTARRQLPSARAQGGHYAGGLPRARGP